MRHEEGPRELLTPHSSLLLRLHLDPFPATIAVRPHQLVLEDELWVSIHAVFGSVQTADLFFRSDTDADQLVNDLEHDPTGPERPSHYGSGSDDLIGEGDTITRREDTHRNNSPQTGNTVHRDRSDRVVDTDPLKEQDGADHQSAGE